MALAITGGCQVNFVALDITITDVSLSTQSIQIAAIRTVNGINETFRAQFINILDPISEEQLYQEPFITSEELQTKADAVVSFLHFISNYPLIVHRLHDTMPLIQRLIEDLGYEAAMLHDVLDTMILAKILLPMEKDYSLTHLIKTYASFNKEVTCLVDLKTAEDSLKRVYMVKQVEQFLKETCLNLPYLTIQDLARSASTFSNIVGEWLNEIANQRMKQYGTQLLTNCDQIEQLVFTSGQHKKNSEEDKYQEPPSFQKSNKLLTEEGPMVNILPGFQSRMGQLQMLDAVIEAFSKDQHLMVEAGTGTGKSLAYLIPAALYAHEQQTRVVVSTHTIALQDQMEHRDLPTLQQLLGEELLFSIFKGRTHYVCMRKLHHEVRNIDFSSQPEDTKQYMMLLVWLTQTKAGMREELALSGRGMDIWQRIQSETETCINKRCPFFKSCYYFRARGEAFEADVIITNHSLVFSDMKADHRVLPQYDKIIFDEAHHLVEEATKHLGDEVYDGQLVSIQNRLIRDGGKRGLLPELIKHIVDHANYKESVLSRLQKLEEYLMDIRPKLDHLFNTLNQLVPNGKTEYRITSNLLDNPVWQLFLNQMDELLSSFTFLDKTRPLLEEWAELEENRELAGRMLDTAGILGEFINQWNVLNIARLPMENWVVWIEKVPLTHRTQLSIHRAPIDIAEILSQSLFTKKSSVILTSATLSVEGNFQYNIENLGLTLEQEEGRLQTIVVPSPFNFKEQALLCIPNDIPELAKMDTPSAATWLSESLYQLAKVSQGRLLALFTSHALLKETAAHLRDPLQTLNIRLLAQGLDGNRSYLLDIFKTHSHSVLLGAQSFWEGIDLPGNTLTTLVIIRLPFSPPSHPVTEARFEKLKEEGKNPFTTTSLPEAVVRFRQGFGRLIRTITDKGVVIVYDKRIIEARYGRTFVRSLGGVQTYINNEQKIFQTVKTFLQD